MAKKKSLRPALDAASLTPRAARRAKQRAENPARAKLMHAARIGGDCGPFFERTIAGKERGQTYHIGCSGWYYRHWYKKFYPATLKASKWFEFYKSNFNTVELNSPFYSWPTVATVRGWIRQAAGDKPFVYTVKVSELITHVKKFTRVKTLIKDFGLISDLLGPHMGCFLFQLPPSFNYTPARLKSIVGQLDLTRRNVVEFRHASWWNERVYKAFQKAGIIFCSCSAPKLPDELVYTAEDVYIRFHGKEKWYRHDYSQAELKIWAKRIRDSKAKRIWVYFNNDFDAFAIKNARELEKILTSNVKTKIAR